jgi:hypothetical protein
LIGDISEQKALPTVLIGMLGELGFRPLVAWRSAKAGN